MIVVRFSDVPEFLEELEAEGRERVDGGIVRVTKIGSLVPLTNLTAVSVEAGFTVPRANLAVNLIPRTQLTLFTKRVGDLWNHEEADAEVGARADVLVREIEVGVNRLGLDVRAGSYTYLLRQHPTEGERP